MPTFSLKVARDCAKNGHFGPAVGNYLGLLKMIPNRTSEWECEFIDTLEKFSECLDIEQTDEFFTAAAEIYPSSSRLMNLWGKIMFRQDRLEESLFCFMQAVSLDSTETNDASRNLANLRTHLVDQWHFRMLNDIERNTNYYNAIQYFVKDRNCSSVLDIGAGTGILSMLSVRANVKEVFACEQSPVMCEIAKKILEENKMTEVRLLPCRSNRLMIDENNSIPKKVDLIITELMDAGFFGENIIGTLFDAKERLLTDNGIIIPQKATIYGVLLQSDDISCQNVIQPQQFCGVIKNSCYFASEICSKTKERASEPYTSEMVRYYPGKYKFLSESFVVDQMVLNSLDDLRLHKNGSHREIQVSVTVSGRLDAILCWFKVELSPDNYLSSHPDCQNSWEQAIFPLSHSNSSLNQDQLVTVSVVVEENWFKCEIANPEYQMSAVTLPQELILQLNDSYLLNSYRVILQSAGNMQISAILDISGLPVLSLLAAHVTGCDVICCYDNSVVMESLLVDNPDLKEKIKFVNSSKREEIEQYLDGNCNDLSFCILCLPVLSNGFLKSSILEDVAYFRAKYNITKVIPSIIDIYGQLINSDQICKFNRVVSDTQTLGLKIKDSINLLATTTQEDIYLSTLEFEPISDKFRLFTLNLEEPIDVNSDKLPKFLHHSQSDTVLVSKSGKIDASLIWYELGSHSCQIRFDSSHKLCHFRQCALVFDNEKVVEKGKLIEMNFEIDRDNIDVCFVN